MKFNGSFRDRLDLHHPLAGSCHELWKGLVKFMARNWQKVPEATCTRSGALVFSYELFEEVDSKVFSFFFQIM